MKKVILKFLLALTIMLSLSACSDLKKEVTVKTSGGERITLFIKVPKEFKKDKDAYLALYPLFYMDAWNEGIKESDNPNEGFEFGLDSISSRTMAALQSSAYLMDEMEEYFESPQGIKEKERIKAEGQAFANKQLKKKAEANREVSQNEQSSEDLKNQEDKPTKTYRRPVINWRE